MCGGKFSSRLHPSWVQWSRENDKPFSGCSRSSLTMLKVKLGDLTDSVYDARALAEHLSQNEFFDEATNKTLKPLTRNKN
jgi:hypothetical protein